MTLVPVAEFASASALRAHYDGVKHRLGMTSSAPPPEPPRAAPAAPPQPPGERELRRRALCERRLDKLRTARAVRKLTRAAMRFVTPGQIIAEVARAHRTTPAEIRGEGRSRSILDARYDALKRLHAAFPARSLPWFGRQLNRDHTTILHALRKLGLRPAKRPGAAA